MHDDLITRVVDLAVQIQQIPAPTFHEDKRAAFVHDLFISEGLSDVEIDAVGNVYACIPGSSESSRIIVSAHLDTVFPRDTDLNIVRRRDRITAPGIGDNSLAIASLFGLWWMLRDRNIKPNGNIWLVANVGEEGLGDLKGMRAVVERFGDKPLAYIVLEGITYGRIYHRALGVKRYRITCKTPGGHSWVNFGRPSAIHELAILVSKLMKIDIPDEPRSSLNVGVITGGTSVNTIADSAQLEVDLRSEDLQTLWDLSEQVLTIVIQSADQDVQVHAEVIGERPAGEIPVEHPLVNLAKRVLLSQGIEPELNIASTDANIPLSEGIPAICIGITTGGGAHTTDEHIHIEPIEKGLTQLEQIVMGVFDVLTGQEAADSL